LCLFLLSLLLGSGTARAVTENVYTVTVSANCTWESLNWTPSVSGTPVPSSSLPPEAVLQMTVTGTPTITVSAPVSVASLQLLSSVTFAYSGTIPASVLEQVLPSIPVKYTPFNFPVTGVASWTYTGESLPTGLTVTNGACLTIEMTSAVKVASVNVNFFRDGTLGTTAEDYEQILGEKESNKETLHGLYPIKGSSWTNIKPVTMSAAALKKVEAEGTVTAVGGGTLAVANGNDAWRVWYTYTPLDKLLRGYIADYTRPILTFADIPFAKFRVIVYFSTNLKNQSFNFVKINDVDYCGTADAVGGVTLKGAATWGKSSTDDTGLALKEGVNCLISDVLVSKICTIAYTPSSSSPGLETGSGIAGVQIVEVVSRVKEEIYTREANVSDNWSATAWTKGSTSGQSWANATTEVSTCAKVDVTKAPTLNVDSAVTATSVAVFGTGNLALTGTGALTASLFDATQLNGTLTLGTTGLLTTVVDTGAGTTVAVDTAENRTYSALTLAGAGTFQKLGAGTVTIAMPSCPIDLQAGGLTLTGAAPSKVTSLVGTTLTVDGAMTVTAETQIAGKLIKNGSGDLSVSNDGNVADVTVNGGNLKILDRSISQLGKVEMLGETELHVDSWNG
ncbi:MAG: hypothetical protein RR133_07065, partial [Kiritimatiellia bacterium]